MQPGRSILVETGAQLVALIGDVDKPEVERNVGEVDNTWQALSDGWTTRQKTLDDALETANSFQDELKVCLQ